MRIGVNARLLHTDRIEGVARYLFETVCAMAKEHTNDEFILFFDRPFSTDFLPYPNMKGFLLSLPTRHPLLILAWFEWLLPKALKQNKIDVFYSPDNFLSLSAKTPTVLVCHDLAYKTFPEGLRWDYRWFYERYMPKYLVRANRIVTVSEFVKEDLQRQFKIENSKITVAYNALPNRQVENKGAQEKHHFQHPYFVFVGALHPRKNVVNLIKAFKLFLTKTGSIYDLVIIGKLAWQTKEIQKMLTFERVKHLKNVKDSELMNILREAEAMVYPSFFEGFGIPILEGFAAEIPVITSSVSAMPEVGGEAVLLVDPHSVESIANAMEKVSKDKVLVQNMVELGNERLKRFNWNKSAERIYETLANLV